MVQPVAIRTPSVRVLTASRTENQRIALSVHRVLQQRVPMHEPRPWEVSLAGRRVQDMCNSVVLARGRKRIFSQVLALL
eukprot:1991147-Pyramimonas_sp.AAC.1